MALTMPFINTLPAFDANIGLQTNIFVLGGDAINGYQFILFDQSNPDVALYTSEVFPVANDIAGTTIRSFPVQIAPFMGIVNNRNYKIRPITFSASQPEGQTGNDALFNCYTTPTVSLQYLDLVNGVSTYVDFSNGITVPSSTVDIQITFNPNDLQSEAQPNYISVDLYGVNNDGTRQIVSTTQNIYIFEHDVLTDLYTATGSLSGFTINVDTDGELLPSTNRQFASYQVEFSLYTIDNMNITGQYLDINCFYNVLRNSPLFSVYNLCNKGVIEINCSLTSLQGTSNIPLSDLIYPNNNSLDLNVSSYPNYNEAWAQWQNYFTLEQPYTLRIWGRNFDMTGDNTTILNMTSTVYGGYYIKLDYIVEGSGSNAETYIALTCGRNDSAGQAMYPYYIESQRIASETITADTNLFIGIQQQNGLFDIDFEIIT